MKEQDIAALDRNLAVAEKVNAPDVRLLDVRQAPFVLYGLYDPQNQPHFQRMPDAVGEAIRPNVAKLNHHPAGGRVRFATDSPYLVIKAEMPTVTHYSHMTLVGTSGFDVYIDAPDGTESMYYRTFVPPYRMENGYESKIDFYTPGLRYITINFPLYNTLDSLFIGVAEGSYLGEGAPIAPFAPWCFTVAHTCRARVPLARATPAPPWSAAR